MKSDLGAATSLSITHAAINTIARNAGIYPLETGDIKWTVNASKGGVVKRTDKVATITVTRGEGIDNIPAELYLYGSATENSGQGGIPFRCVEEGVSRFIRSYQQEIYHLSLLLQVKHSAIILMIARS